MSAGVTALLTLGAQDIYLTTDPEVSFFRSNYKRHTHFANAIERQTIQGNPNPGTMSSVFPARSGDLLSYMYITAHNPASNNLVTNIDWSGAIDRIQLYIGGNLIDTQDDVFSTIIAPVTMTDSYSKRFGGIGSGAGVTNNYQNTFYPLTFFFCQDWQNALPLGGMQFQTIEIRIYWSTSLNSALQYNMWAEYLYLDGPERDYFTNIGNGPDGKAKAIDMLVWQVQSVFVPASTDALLPFTQPVKFIAGQVLTYTNGKQTLNYNINGGTNENQEFRGLPHFQEIPLYYHTPQGLTNPGSALGNLAPPPVLVIPFCLDTAKLQPTGTINFSRIDSFDLVTDSSTGVQLTGTSPAIFAAGSMIYAVNYNILRVQAGMAALLYAN
jgi:hypothetical protein